jgi:flagellar hook-associated protein 3 FlgL
VYNVRPSGTTDVFSILSEIVAAVEAPTTLGENEARAVFEEKLGYALTNIQSAMDNVLKYRANYGSRMQEAEQLQSAGSDRGLHYSTTLSRLQDVDLTKTISELSQVEMTLQAAQMSFSQVSKLSLFNYL